MMKKFFGKIVAIATTVAMVGTIPIQVGAEEISDDFEIEAEIQPGVYEDTMTDIMKPLTAESLEISEEMKGAEDIIDSDSGENFEIEAINASASKFYQQPEWYVRSGYDCVMAYVRDGSEYIYRVFFITDGQEWLLYDYGEYTSEEFFTKVEVKDGKYIPVKKAESRKNNSKTPSIDESKVPVVTAADYNNLRYDWRKLENMPFVRDSAGKLLYAGSNGEHDSSSDAGSGDSGSGSGDDSGTSGSEEIAQDGLHYTVGVKNSVYDIVISDDVTYNGRKHVAVGSKSNKKQTGDVSVKVYRNGKVLSKKKYSLRFYNSKNTNDYGGTNKKPMVQIILKNKGKLKKEMKPLAKMGFVFTIKPIDISTVNFTLGKKNAKAVIDGKKLKLSPQSTVNPKLGAYVVKSYDAATGVVTIAGVNNYTGEVKLIATSSQS